MAQNGIIDPKMWSNSTETHLKRKFMANYFYIGQLQKMEPHFDQKMGGFR